MMTLPSGSKIPSESTQGSANPFVITSVSMKQDEAVTHLKCFNDAIYTYAFGADTGDVQVEFLAFLTTGGGAGAQGGTPAYQAGGAFGTALSLYKDARISASKKPVSLVIGINGGTISGQLVGMQSGTYSNELNIQKFNFILKLVKTQEGK